MSKWNIFEKVKFFLNHYYIVKIWVDILWLTAVSVISFMQFLKYLVKLVLLYIDTYFIYIGIGNSIAVFEALSNSFEWSNSSFDHLFSVNLAHSDLFWCVQTICFHHNFYVYFWNPWDFRNPNLPWKKNQFLVLLFKKVLDQNLCIVLVLWTNQKYGLLDKKAD